MSFPCSWHILHLNRSFKNHVNIQRYSLKKKVHSSWDEMAKWLRWWTAKKKSILYFNLLLFFAWIQTFGFLYNQLWSILKNNLIFNKIPHLPFLPLVISRKEKCYHEFVSFRTFLDKERRYNVDTNISNSRQHVPQT